MQKFFLSLILSLLALPCVAQAVGDTCRHEVLFETNMGNIRVALYNDTPLHRDNFLRHVREGYYDGLLFHRVVPDFVIQAGDSASRHAKPGERLGESPEEETVAAEINFPRHFHKAGALAAAREDDSVNPSLASSATQFYIVTGRIYSEASLDRAQAYLDSISEGATQLTPAVRTAYQQEGGMPYLDGRYTVFGEIVEGLDTAYRIQWAARDEYDRPFDDVRIIKGVVVK